MPSQYPNTDSSFLSSREKLSSAVPSRFLIFSVAVFLFALLIYAGLALGYKSFLQNSIADSEKEMEALSRKISPEGQSQLIKFNSQISNLDQILASHVKSSQIFTFLEKNTQEKTAYRILNLSVPDRKLTLEGVSASYDDLVTQLAIYEQSPEVERLNLESSDGSGGNVRFKVNLVLAPALFKF